MPTRGELRYGIQGLLRGMIIGIVVSYLLSNWGIVWSVIPIACYWASRDLLAALFAALVEPTVRLICWSLNLALRRTPIRLETEQVRAWLEMKLGSGWVCDLSFVSRLEDRLIHWCLVLDQANQLVNFSSGNFSSGSPMVADNFSTAGLDNFSSGIPTVADNFSTAGLNNLNPENFRSDIPMVADTSSIEGLN